MPKIRIIDIARAAGVSAGTVDRVLHNRGGVAKDAENKVRATIKSLNYQPNLVARSLATRGIYRIAIILPLKEKDEFWIDQTRGIKRGLQSITDFGFFGELLYFDDQIQGDLLNLSEKIFNGNYDAILIAPTLREDGLKLLEQSVNYSIPYVQINTFIRSDNPYNLGFVGQDSFRSGQLAAKLLNLCSATEGTFGILHMEKDVDSRNHLIEKEAGFRRYFENFPSRKIISKKLTKIKNAIYLKKQISDLLLNHTISGLFVTTSRVHYVAKILNELRRTDITLVGFDLITENIEALSGYNKLFLINQNPSLQGYYGVMRLFDHLFKKETQVQKKYLPLDIITLENVSNYIHIRERDNVEKYENV